MIGVLTRRLAEKLSAPEEIIAEKRRTKDAMAVMEKLNEQL